MEVRRLQAFAAVAIWKRLPPQYAVFAGSMLIAAINFVASIIVTRELSPHDRGIFAFLVFLSGAVGTFGHLGVPQHATALLVRQELSVKRNLRLGISITLASGLPVALLFALIADETFTSSPGFQQLCMVTTASCIFVFWSFVQATLRGNDQWWLLSITGCIQAIGQLIGVLVLSSAGLMSPFALLLNSVLVAILSTLGTTIIILYHSPKDVAFETQPPSFISISRAGSLFLPVLLVDWLVTAIDRLVLSSSGTAEQLGQWAAATSFLLPISLLGEALAQVAFNSSARRSGLAGKGDQATTTVKSSTPKIRHALLFFVLVFYTAAGFYAIPVLLGEAYRAAAWYFLILVPAWLLRAYCRIQDFHWRAKHEIARVVKVNGALALVTYVLGLTLFSAFNMYGLVAAITIAQVLAIMAFRARPARSKSGE